MPPYKNLFNGDSNVAGAFAQPEAAVDPTHQFMQWMMQQQHQQQQAPIDFASLFSQLRNDPQGDANHGYVPGANGPHNPFSNGFFNNSAGQLSPEARAATQGRSAMTQWAQQGQVPGVDPTKLAGVMGGMTPIPAPSGIPSVDQFSDPQFIHRQQQNPYSTMFQGQGQQPGPVIPPMTRQLPGGGMEGIINPNAANLFGDANSYGASRQTSLPPGTVAGDGRTNYRRKKVPSANGSPKPGFSFGGMFR